MKNPDILLVAPPTRAYSIYFSFALIYLAAFLEKNGKSVQIIDIRRNASEGYTLENLEDLCAKDILEKNSKHIGFTCMTAEYNCVNRIVRRLRNKNFRGKIIVGGHHPSFCPEDFFVEKGLYDFVVLGEGEITLLELLNYLERNGDISKVDGIAYKLDNKMQKTSPRMLIENIDILPLPAYHLLDMAPYTLPTIGLIRHILVSGLTILTTRGCPYKCTYCGNPTLWTVHNYNKVLRTRSIAHVLDELEFLKSNYNIESFYIADDSFTLTENRVKEFCKGLKSKNLNLIWGCQTHINLFKENMAKWMKDAGCVQVEFGVESGSDRILKEMKKGTKTDQIKRVFDICKKYRLRTLANLMINTPTETEEDLKKTVSFAKKLKPTIYSYAVTVPLVGTEVYEKYVIPKLTREEYSIYLDSRIYNSITDKRFKLHAHNKNISLIYCYLYYRYMFLRFYFDSLIYFFKNQKFYKKSFKRNEYYLAIFKRYTVLNHIIKLFNKILRRLKNSKSSNLDASSQNKD